MADDIAEGAPQGRTDPGGGGLGQKIGPLPLGLWILAGAGILGFFWWQRAHSSGTSAATSGTASGAAAGVTAVDTNTLQGLLMAMQDIASRYGSGSVSPPPASGGSSVSEPHRTPPPDSILSASDARTFCAKFGMVWSDKANGCVISGKGGRFDSLIPRSLGLGGRGGRFDPIRPSPLGSNAGLEIEDPVVASTVHGPIESLNTSHTVGGTSTSRAAYDWRIVQGFKPSEFRPRMNRLSER